MDSNVVSLDGESLTFVQLKAIAEGKAKVFISDKGREKAESARRLIFLLDEKGSPVYGLNMGVGWNKDRKIPANYYPEYNCNLLKSHMIGIAPECSMEEVRLMMAIRLNKILCGHTGVSMEVMEYLAQFLNKGITPVVMKRGSVGEADIGTLSGIGLVMIGQGDAYIDGIKYSGEDALERMGMEPLLLGPKDGLGIVSSNAQSASFAVKALMEVEDLIERNEYIYCLSLEALNGVVDPLDQAVNIARGFKGQIKSAKKCSQLLEGSYLYQSNEQRALQDPLSFRSHCAVIGSVMDMLAYAKEQVMLEINSSDDNPCLLPEEERSCGSSNFETLSWVLALESLAIGLSHLSKMSVNRMLHLANPTFTKLSRFLSPDEQKTIAFGTIQKLFTSLDTENRFLANPVSLDFTPIAGNIEDHASNAGACALKILTIVDNLYYILGMELMHAAQAVDLRRPVALGIKTETLYEKYRTVIPFLDKDRNLSEDIQKSYRFLKKEKEWS